MTNPSDIPASLREIMRMNVYSSDEEIHRIARAVVALISQPQPALVDLSQLSPDQNEIIIRRTT